jgi:hypothetical protein
VGTVCRPAAGQCDVAEACTGSDVICPSDEFVPDDTACDDGDYCTASDVCLGGSCQGAQCLDGDFCPTSALVVDFDDVEAPDAFGDAEPLMDQYADKGVRWLGTGAVLQETSLPSVEMHSLPNFAAYSDEDTLLDGTPTLGADVLELSCPVTGLSLCVGAEDDSNFTVIARDRIGVPIDWETNLPISQDVRCVELQGEVGREIASVDYFNTAIGEGDGIAASRAPRFAVDEIQVPEPGGTLLAFVSLALVAALAGRRRE